MYLKSSGVSGPDVRYGDVSGVRIVAGHTDLDLVGAVVAVQAQVRLVAPQALLDVDNGAPRRNGRAGYRKVPERALHREALERAVAVGVERRVPLDDHGATARGQRRDRNRRRHGEGEVGVGDRRRQRVDGDGQRRPCAGRRALASAPRVRVVARAPGDLDEQPARPTGSRRERRVSLDVVGGVPVDRVRDREGHDRKLPRPRVRDREDVVWNDSSGSALALTPTSATHKDGRSPPTAIAAAARSTCRSVITDSCGASVARCVAGGLAGCRCKERSTDCPAGFTLGASSEWGAMLAHPRQSRHRSHNSGAVGRQAAEGLFRG